MGCVCMTGLPDFHYFHGRFHTIEIPHVLLRAAMLIIMVLYTIEIPHVLIRAAMLIIMILYTIEILHVLIRANNNDTLHY